MMDSKIAKKLEDADMGKPKLTTAWSTSPISRNCWGLFPCLFASPCAAPPRNETPPTEFNRRPNHSERYVPLGWKNSSIEDPTVSVLSTIALSTASSLPSSQSLPLVPLPKLNLPLRPSTQHLATHCPINSQLPQSCPSEFPKLTTSWTFSA